jgi:hypothetical protein
MTKRRLTWVACLVAVVLALPALPFAYYAVLGKLRQEPFYHGLPASYWGRSVRSWCRSGKPVTAVPCVGKLLAYFGLASEPAVLRGDPETVPVLLVLLRAREEGVRQEAAIHLLRFEPDVPLMRGVFAAYDDASPGCREAALVVLFDVQLRKTFGALRLNPTQLMEGLADSDPRIRAWAAARLGELGPNARPAVSALAAALGDENEEVREAADRALATINPNREWSTIAGWFRGTAAWGVRLIDPVTPGTEGAEHGAP